MILQFTDKIIEGTLIKRYKRFLADIQLSNGQIITAHVPNSGSMLGVNSAGEKVYVAYCPAPNKKLDYRLELVEKNNVIIGINTNYPNQIVENALSNNLIEELKDYKIIRREVKYGSQNSRIDILLAKNNLTINDFKDASLLPNQEDLCYLEIKSVHMKRKKDLAEFPDAVTSRGTKHLEELEEALKKGAKSVILWLIQRNDCNKFAIANDIDPKYYNTLKQAIASGVIPIAYSCIPSKTGYIWGKKLEIII